MPAQQGEFAEAMQQMTQGLDLGVQPQAGMPRTESYPVSPVGPSSPEFNTSGGLPELYNKIIGRIKAADKPSSGIVEGELSLKLQLEGTKVGQAIRDMEASDDPKEQLKATQLREAAMQKGSLYRTRFTTDPFYKFTLADYDKFASFATKLDALKGKSGEQAQLSEEGKQFISGEAEQWKLYIYDTDKGTPKNIEGEIKRCIAAVNGPDSVQKGLAREKLAELTTDSAIKPLSLFFLIDNALQREEGGRLSFVKYLAAKTKLDTTGRMSDEETRILARCREISPVLNATEDLPLRILTDEVQQDRQYTKADKEIFAYMRAMVGKIASAAGRDFGRGAAPVLPSAESAIQTSRNIMVGATTTTEAGEGRLFPITVGGEVKNVPWAEAEEHLRAIAESRDYDRDQTDAIISRYKQQQGIS